MDYSQSYILLNFNNKENLKLSINIKTLAIVLLLGIFLSMCKKDPPLLKELRLISLKSGDYIISTDATNQKVPADGSFTAEFNVAIDTNSVKKNIFLLNEKNDTINFSFTFSEDHKKVYYLPKNL